MKYPIGIIASTGEKCPESRVWKVVGEETTIAPLAKGNKMPPYKNKGVVWVIIQYA